MRPQESELPADSPARSLDRAMSLCAALVSGVAAEQWEDPTPCTEWSVRDLVRHVASGNRHLASALGATADQAADVPQHVSGSAPETATEDVAQDFAASVPPLVDALADPAALRQTVTVPFGTVPVPVAVHLRTTEALVHGWDLARATGQPFDVPEDLAGAELAFSRGALASLPPGRSPFGPSQPVADDAPALDRLAALLGRRVPSSPESS